MSTRIDGILIRHGLDEAHGLLQGLRPEVRDVVDGLILDHLAKATAERLDHAALDGRRPEGALRETLEDFDRRRGAIQRTRMRDPEVDFGLELWLLPLPGRTPAIVSCEHRAPVDLLTGRDDVVEYGYRDDTDRPDLVAEDEWERRRLDWAEAMPTGVPADRCLTYRFHDGAAPTVDRTDLVRRMPTLAGRVAPMARRRLMAEHHERLAGGAANLSATVPAAIAAARDDRAGLERIEAEIASMLPERHEVGDLD